MSMLALNRPAMAPAVLEQGGLHAVFVRDVAGGLLSCLSIGFNAAVCALAIVALLA